MSEGFDLKKMARELVSEVGERAGISGIKEALGELEAAGRKHRVEATVTTAIELDAGQRERIEAQLRQTHGEDLPIGYRVDPSILGGVVVRVGDRYIDGSVATRLGKLRQSLTGGGAG